MNPLIPRLPRDSAPRGRTATRVTFPSVIATNSRARKPSAPFVRGSDSPEGIAVAADARKSKRIRPPTKPPRNRSRETLSRRADKSSDNRKIQIKQKPEVTSRTNVEEYEIGRKRIKKKMVRHDRTARTTFHLSAGTTLWVYTFFISLLLFFYSVFNHIPCIFCTVPCLAVRVYFCPFYYFIYLLFFSTLSCSPNCPDPGLSCRANSCISLSGYVWRICPRGSDPATTSASRISSENRKPSNDSRLGVPMTNSPVYNCRCFFLLLLPFRRFPLRDYSILVRDFPFPRWRQQRDGRVATFLFLSFPSLYRPPTPRTSGMRIFQVFFKLETPAVTIKFIFSMQTPCSLFSAPRFPSILQPLRSNRYHRYYDSTITVWTDKKLNTLLI